MTQAGVKLQHSGRAALPACTRELGAIEERPWARIGSRLVPPAGAVGALPRNLRRSGGVGRFALGRNGPVGIACVLVGAHSPADPHGDPDPERRVDPKKAPHDDLRELLEEKARLDREYDRLFLRALAFGVPPLTLFDDSKGGRAPIYVCDYIDDLQASRADNTWMASSCTWQGSATLYEVTQPRSRGEDDVGRRLCLPRQANVDSRADLAAIAPEALCYPPGKGPADFPGQPWVPKAAEASY
jgi:hypothetical protein